jgi:hypothetical protein
MWTRTLQTCFAAIGLLTAATLAGCVVDGERQAPAEIQSNVTTHRPACAGLDQAACFANRDHCVQIWQLPASCPPEQAEICTLEFVECSEMGQGCGRPGLPACPDE